MPNVVCPHCRAVNRIPEARSATAAKCGDCHQPLFEGAALPVTATSFQKHIDRNDIPVLVDFWAEWCGPCKAMAPIFARAAKDLEPELRFLKVDTEAEPALANRYNVRGIPTMILFKNGQPAEQQVGAVGDQALRAWIREHIA